MKQHLKDTDTFYSNKDLLKMEEFYKLKNQTKAINETINLEKKLSENET